MIITKYLNKEVFITLLSVTFVLLFIFISQEFVKYLAQAAEGKLPISIVLKMMLFTIPYLLGILLPLGFYLGVLLAYGRLYVDSEMTVLTACGIGQGYMVKTTLLQAILVTAVVAFLTLWLNPVLSAYTEKLRASAKESISLVQTVMPGQFKAFANGAQVYYVDKMSRDRKQMQGIFIAQQVPAAKRNDALSNVGQTKPNKARHTATWEILSASRGFQYIDSETGDRFLVGEDGYSYKGVPGSVDFRIVQYKTLGVRVDTPDEDVDIDEQAAVPTRQLWQIAKNDIAAAAELQTRLSSPLMVLLLGFLAVPLSRVKPRQGKYAKLLPSILIYVLYANLMFVGKGWIESGKLSPQIGLWWLHVVIFLVAIGLYAVHYNWRPLLRKFMLQGGK